MDQGSVAYRDFLRARLAEFDANMRAPRQTALSLLIIVATPFALLLPGARDALRVSFWQAAPLLFIAAFISVCALLAYRAGGAFSRTYRLLDDLETIGVQVSLGALIVLSGTAVSPFWFFYMGHALLVSVRPSLSNSMLFVAGGTPLAVALAFLALEGISSSFFSSLVAASMGVLTVSFTAGLQARLAKLAFERDALQRQVADLEIEAERRRIARDLHDGLTADLTAIAWRAEVLARSPEDASLTNELGSIAQRARSAIDDTRSVVWALRDEAVSWPSLVEHVQSRCVELCSARANLTFRADPSDQQLPGQLALDIVRIVQESVRNALQHGAPSTVAVTMDIAEEIVLTIEDDGTGLVSAKPVGGGLRNVARRAEEHAGLLHLGQLDRGTRISVQLPVPSDRTASEERPLVR